MPFSNSSPLSVLFSFPPFLAAFCVFFSLLFYSFFIWYYDKPIADASDDDSKNIAIYYCNTACMYICMQSQTHTGTRISQHDLIKRSHHHWRKKLSTCGENDTTANEDIAMTSSMSIRDLDRGEKM